MSRRLAHVYLGALAVIVLFGIYAVSSSTEAQSEPTRTVQWLLAHEPADVYENAIEVFADELARESGGRLRLETVTPSQLGITGQVSHEQILELLEAGTVELSSTFGVANGVHDGRFWVWQLPFLFNGYEDIEVAFESATGQQLLDGLSDHAPFRALAYTLSGGLRVIASPRELPSLESLRGLRIATAGGPVAEATLRAVGAIPVPMGSEGSTVGAEDIDAIETTYARLSSAVGSRSEFAKYVNETNHNLFLTTLVASDAFYDSLSPEDQGALTRAARKAAAVERAEAVALNARTRAELGMSGSIITVFQYEERDAFVQATAGIYDTVASVLGVLPDFSSR